MVSFSRGDLMKYAALLLILVFVGETVFLGLSNSNSAVASVSPTPAAVSFSGFLTVPASVLELGPLGLAACNVSGVDVQLKGVPGVKTALFASAGLLAVQFESANVSVEPAEFLVADACGAPMFRSAIVDLPGSLSFNSSSGPQDVSGRQLDAYFRAQGLSGSQAFVSPGLKVGDAVNVTVSVDVQDDRFASVNLEQPEAEVAGSLALRRLGVALVPVVSPSASATAVASSQPGSANGSSA